MRLIAALVLLLLSGCTGYLFQPMQLHVLEPAKLGIPVRDVYFETPDRVRLHGWLLPAKTAKAEGTVLFLHGNAENVSTHIGSVYWLPDYGFNVFMFDYRGYGRSQGKPTLAGLHTDFGAALETLLQMDGIDPERIVVFGQSMGGATTITALAKSRYRSRVRALIVEGAPTTYRSVAREKLSEWWATWLLQWPLSLTINDLHRYRPVDQIASISPTPIVIVHSRTDEVIPFHHGQELYAAAHEPKELWAVEEARHIAVFTTAEQRQRLADYLRKALAAPQEQAQKAAAAE
jgi:fermentation-respiration switch protein FrsA (DUF1100 family)